MEDNLKYLQAIKQLNEYVSITEAALLITTGSIGLVLQVGWSIHVIMKIRLAYQKMRRIKNIQQKDQHTRIELIECENRITQGKFLFTLLTLEFISFISYWLGFLYPELTSISPFLKNLSLPYNSTCISIVYSKRAWVHELRYPPTFIFLCFARTNSILILGVVVCLFKFISNTYVTKIWKYEKIYRPIKYTVVFSVIIFILGVIPQFIVFGRLLALIIFLTLFIQTCKHAKFFSRVLKWRSQDLYHNNELLLLKLHKKQNEYFNFSIITLAIGVLLFYLAEVIEFIEIIIGLFLYYGQCLFPYLYNVYYQSPLRQDQLPTFEIFLLIFAIIEKTLITAGTLMFAGPYIIMTITLIVKTKIEERRTAYCYSLRESLL